MISGGPRSGPKLPRKVTSLSDRVSLDGTANVLCGAFTDWLPRLCQKFHRTRESNCLGPCSSEKKAKAEVSRRDQDTYVYVELHNELDICASSILLSLYGHLHR